MIKIISYKPELKDQVITLIKEVMEKEFGFPVNRQMDPYLYDIHTYFQKDGGNFWIAIDSQKVIGTLGFLNYYHGRGYLRAMCLHKEYRRKGITTRLFQTLIHFAQRNNFKVIYLVTAEKMLAAIKFYEKVGFIRIDSLPKDMPLVENALFFKFKLQ